MSDFSFASLIRNTDLLRLVGQPHPTRHFFIRHVRSHDGTANKFEGASRCYAEIEEPYFCYSGFISNQLFTKPFKVFGRTNQHQHITFIQNCIGTGGDSHPVVCFSQTDNRYIIFLLKF